jgi:hypothetical protein
MCHTCQADILSVQHSIFRRENEPQVLLRGSIVTKALTEQLDCTVHTISYVKKTRPSAAESEQGLVQSGNSRSGLRLPPCAQNLLLAHLPSIISNMVHP